MIIVIIIVMTQSGEIFILQFQIYGEWVIRTSPDVRDIDGAPFVESSSEKIDEIRFDVADHGERKRSGGGCSAGIFFFLSSERNGEVVQISASCERSHATAGVKGKILSTFDEVGQRFLQDDALAFGANVGSVLLDDVFLLLSGRRDDGLAGDANFLGIDAI